MKKFILFLFILFSIYSEDSLKQETIFEKLNFKEAQTKAKKEKKGIFLDASADWCTPCIWMEKNVYNQNEVIESMKDRFISIKIDFDKEELILKEKLKIDSYPILLYFNSRGELIHRYRGPLKKEDFISESKKAFNPDQAFYSLKYKYERLNISQKLLYQYILAYQKAWGYVDNSILDSYFSKEKDLYKEENWKLIDSYLTDMDSFTFKLFKEKRFQFQKRFSKDVVEKKFLLTMMQHHSKKENWELYAKVAFEYAEKYLDNDWKSLDGIAWKLAEHSDDKNVLRRAEFLAKKSIQLEPNFLNYETLAIINLKLGKLKESHQAISTSMNLAKEINESLDSGIEILHKIINQTLEKK